MVAALSGSAVVLSSPIPGAAYTGGTSVDAARVPGARASEGNATTTRLTSSANSSVFGQVVTFTATVAAPVDHPKPTGSVTFVDGTVDIGAVELSDGVASFSSSFLSEGTHTITARYSGDAIYAPSASPALTQTVMKTGAGVLGGMDARLVNGSALTKIPGAEGFEELGADEVRQIPEGSLVDATRGIVRITVTLPDGALQSAEFSLGVFQVLRSRSLITITLIGGSFAECDNGQPGTSDTVIRQLSANATGRFRTRGRHSSATVRGTVWSVSDRCDGTLTSVREGTVAVRDFRKRKTVVVSAGESYLARRRLATRRGPR
jgi:hypothetical protein